MRYITSNATDDAVWHAASERHLCGARIGRVLSVYYVATCSGRQLGGAFGSTTVEHLPMMATLCRRCFPDNFDEAIR